MGLSPIQYREIMQEYDQIRQANYRLAQRRQDEVYEKVPQIRTIDQQIASESLSAARKLIFQPKADADMETFLPETSLPKSSNGLAQGTLRRQKEDLHEKVSDLIRQKKELLEANHFPADYLEAIYSCPACKDTGYVGDQKCHCFQKRIQELLLQESNLTHMISQQSFDHFRLDYYSTKVPHGRNLSPRDNMKNVLDISYNFIRNFDSEPGKNILFHGATGVGKTFLSICIAGELLKRGKSVVYVTAYELFEQLADYAFRRKEQIAPPALLQADLLIIDDLGTEMNNVFINSQLFLCLNERILRKKSTIISTNYSLKELSQTYTERISSRLIQYYTLVHIFGEDIRIKKAFTPID